MRVLVTGGAGFVGSNLAVALQRRRPGTDVVSFDNLRRRGSELNLPRLRAQGVEFVHGDVRSPGDLAEAGGFDLLVECSAEPSVVRMEDGAREYLLDTNLVGALNCAEACKRHGAGMLFISTSRIYPIALLCDACYHEEETRFVLEKRQPVAGLSQHGVSEDFPLAGARSFYGATKYGAEILLEEYRHAFDLPVIVDRCGVIAGPWQFGKVDQGIVGFWVLSHLRGEPLNYIGFGGTGKQVRDVLHVEDFCELVLLQIDRLDHFEGRTFNVGGGLASSVSLVELTELCREVTGQSVEIGSIAESRYADVPVYLTDGRRLEEHCGWRPRRGPRDIVRDVHDWLREQPDALLAAR